MNERIEFLKGLEKPNTIEHDGKTYEVLPLGDTARCQFLDHAQIKDGVIVHAQNAGCGHYQIDEYVMPWQKLKEWGITPLRLVPKVPVEFVGANAEFLVRVGGGFDIVRLEVPRGSLGSDIDGKTFRCVEVTE